MDLGLKGKKALVTGSSRGLGFATANQLAEEGCDIAINSRSSERLEAAKRQIASGQERKIVPIIADVSMLDIPDRIVRQAAESLGGLDILVTNSGGPPSGKFEAFNDQAWQDAIELNFLSQDYQTDCEFGR